MSEGGTESQQPNAALARVRAMLQPAVAWLAEGGWFVWSRAFGIAAAFSVVPLVLYFFDAYNVRNFTYELLFGLPYGAQGLGLVWAGLVVLLIVVGDLVATACYAFLKRDVPIERGELVLVRSITAQLGVWIPLGLLLVMGPWFSLTAKSEDTFVGDVGLAAIAALVVGGLMARDLGNLRLARISSASVTLEGWTRRCVVPLASLTEVRWKNRRAELVTADKTYVVPAEELSPVAQGDRWAGAVGPMRPSPGGKSFVEPLRAILAEAQARDGSVAAQPGADDA